MNNEMPDEIYVDCKINDAGYFQVDQFSKKELQAPPLPSFNRVKYVRADKAVPDGFVLVPIEPTDEMPNAAVDATGAGIGMSWVNRSPQKIFRVGYKAMLSAAPQPPTKRD